MPADTIKLTHIRTGHARVHLNGEYIGRVRRILGRWGAYLPGDAVAYSGAASRAKAVQYLVAYANRTKGA